MEEQFDDRDSISLKGEIMTRAFFFPKPRGRESAVLACCQDSSLKTYQFFLINKIRPQAVYKGRMCNNY